MRLMSGLYIGELSLATHGVAIGSIADNISNANTPGFKSGRTNFADVMSDSVGSLFGSSSNGGNGVLAEQVQTIFTQGGLETTGRGLDSAITGNGFFAVTDGTSNFYTRAGNFVLDAEGSLRTGDGKSVLGFTPESPDTPVSLSTASVTSGAATSTTGSLGGNLDSRAEQVAAAANPATFEELQAASSFSNSVRVFDTLGEQHDILLHFFKTGLQSYDVQAYVDGAEVNGEAGVPTQVGTTTLTFNTAGVQDAESSLAIAANWGNGAAAGAVALDLSSMTSFASGSNIADYIVDGNAAGSVTGIEIDKKGDVVAVLNTGESATIGTLAVATFTNNNGLSRIGSNLFLANSEAGEVSLGVPGSSGRGSVSGGTIEASTVDLANEFVNLVRLQRGYQAGSQVIQTVNDLVRQTVDLA